MKEEEKKTEIISGQQEGLKVLRRDLAQDLIKGPERLIVDKGSDEQLDQLNLVYELLREGKIDKTSLKIIANKVQRHPSQFYLKYYEELYRLLVIDRDPKIYFKPKIIAEITNELIYGRFEKSVLPSLRIRNNYVAYCIRANKHYQLLTSEGILILQQFISQSIDAMMECQDYYQFRLLMYSRHNVQYQKDLFKS